MDKVQASTNSSFFQHTYRAAVSEASRLASSIFGLFQNPEQTSSRTTSWMLVNTQAAKGKTCVITDNSTSWMLGKTQEIKNKLYIRAHDRFATFLAKPEKYSTTTLLAVAIEEAIRERDGSNEREGTAPRRYDIIPIMRRAYYLIDALLSAIIAYTDPSPTIGCLGYEQIVTLQSTTNINTRNLLKDRSQKEEKALQERLFSSLGNRFVYQNICCMLFAHLIDIATRRQFTVFLTCGALLAANQPQLEKIVSQDKVYKQTLGKLAEGIDKVHGKVRLILQTFQLGILLAIKRAANQRIKANKSSPLHVPPIVVSLNQRIIQPIVTRTARDTQQLICGWIAEGTIWIVCKIIVQWKMRLSMSRYPLLGVCSFLTWNVPWAPPRTTDAIALNALSAAVWYSVHTTPISFFGVQLFRLFTGACVYYYRLAERTKAITERRVEEANLSLIALDYLLAKLNLIMKKLDGQPIIEEDVKKLHDQAFVDQLFENDKTVLRNTASILCYYLTEELKEADASQKKLEMSAKTINAAIISPKLSAQIDSTKRLLNDFGMKHKIAPSTATYLAECVKAPFMWILGQVPKFGEKFSQGRLERRQTICPELLEATKCLQNNLICFGDPEAMKQIKARGISDTDLQANTVQKVAIIQSALNEYKSLNLWLAPEVELAVAALNDYEALMKPPAGITEWVAQSHNNFFKYIP